MPHISRTLINQENMLELVFSTGLFVSNKFTCCVLHLGKYVKILMLYYSNVFLVKI